MTKNWWNQVNGAILAQGDLIPDCIIPYLPSDNEIPALEATIYEQTIDRARLIVITQSCDLENNKADHVALCAIHTMDEFVEINPKFKSNDRRENVRKGRVPALHLLASTEEPENNQKAFIADFGNIISLPFEYLTSHVEVYENRYRLRSPFLEHFSQSIARFFMRVGLPSGLPPYK